MPHLIMRLASIDIGTNTILMLLADVESDGSISIVKDEHVIARLGKGVDKYGIIQKETFSRICDILSQLKNIACTNGAQHFTVCGTSALRDAANRQEFIDFIREQLAIEIRILSGNEEAELTYLGAVSEYMIDFPQREYAVLDIGGGSTELVAGIGYKITSALSIDIGSVRLTERILKMSPPEKFALENACKFVNDHIQSISILSHSTMLIGVAGTLTTLAALDLHLPDFNRSLINRHTLTRESIDRIFQELSPLTLDQLKSYRQIHPSRADILLAGILILRELLIKTHVTQITVSERGLRYGMLIQFARTLSSSIREKQTKN